MGSCEFREVDLNLHSTIAVKFMADTYAASFGTDSEFWGEDGKGGDRYVDWLKNQGKANACFHLWEDNEIIGQVSLGRRNVEDDFGYVNVVYLRPDKRGQRYSFALDQFIVNFLRRLGFNKARLSVSPSNIRAVRYFEKTGWKDIGQRTGPNPMGKTFAAPVHYMERSF